MAGAIDYLIPGVGTGLQVAGNIYGQIQANKAQKRYDAFLNQRRNDLASKLSISQNEDYLNTDAARSALEQVRKNMKEVSKATANSAVQGGATPESVIATEGKLQSKYQDAVTSLLNAGQQRKDRDKYLYEGIGTNLDNQNAANLAGKIGQWGQFGANVNQAAGNLMFSYANGGFGKGGSSSASTPIYGEGPDSDSMLQAKYKFTPGTGSSDELPNP